MVDTLELLENQNKSNCPLPNKSISNEINDTTSWKETLRYETHSNRTIKRIVDVLENIDIYEDKESCECFPDYKFPETRWDETMTYENPDSMTDDEIKNKFQLLNEEVEQQKREVCRRCYQTGKRGIAFDICYFYKGDENWDNKIPKKGKAAELGCEGCAWYDFAEWRKHLLKALETNK